MWEYRVVTETIINLEHALNALGNEGFEVIYSQFSPATPPNPDSRYLEPHNPLVTVILKRPRPAY